MHPRTFSPAMSATRTETPPPPKNALVLGVGLGDVQVIV